MSAVGSAAALGAVDMTTVAPEPRVRRLSWAGIQIEAEGASLFIDPWRDTSFFGDAYPRTPVEPQPEASRRYVLLTHLHRDHFDREVVSAILTEPGASGAVVAGEPLAAELGSILSVPTRGVGTYRPERVGPATVIPLPAVDGWGAFQVSWFVEVSGTRLFHGGDGLWHGNWWKWAAAYGPFDLAFLPINGVTTPGGTPSVHVPRTLDPRSAAEAAVALGAKVVVPIHFGVTVPGIYEETPEAQEVFGSTASELGVHVRFVEEGTWLAY